MGEATEVPRRSPSRGPPYWKSRVLRRQAHGDVGWMPQRRDKRGAVRAQGAGGLPEAWSGLRVAWDRCDAALSRSGTASCRAAPAPSGWRDAAGRALRRLRQDRELPGKSGLFYLRSDTDPFPPTHQSASSAPSKTPSMSPPSPYHQIRRRRTKPGGIFGERIRGTSVHFI